MITTEVTEDTETSSVLSVVIVTLAASRDPASRGVSAIEFAAGFEWTFAGVLDYCFRKIPKQFRFAYFLNVHMQFLPLLSEA